MNIKTNIENLEAYKLYIRVQNCIHEYLTKKGYLQIDLPVLSPALIPESYLEVFETEYTFLDKREKLYLTPSPELFLKRLLTYGIGNCYSLGKSFRNSEPDSMLHGGEFMMLEFYKMNATYMDIAEELLSLMQHIAIHTSGSPSITYKGHKISLAKWEKLTVAQAFSQYAGISDDELFNHDDFIQQAKVKGYVVERFTYEDLFSQIYAQEVEPHLGMNGYPTLLYDYPKEFAALATLNNDGKTAQRFEFYIRGIELGDCYSELTDPTEQEQRFQDEYKKRKDLGKYDHPIDKGFIEALQYGLKPCAGIAIGIDRLAMLYADADTIHELKLITIS